MDNRLRHLSGLRYFEVAARLSNYSKAAEELFVTQAAVSQKIRQLEEQLGCKLFIRKGRAMTLTHEGHTLFRHVSDGFQEVLLGLNKIQSEPIQGLLVVRSPPSFASRWLLPRLWKFSVKHPEIPIKILTGCDTPNLKHGEIDVAIRQGEDLCVEEGLTLEMLINEPVYPFCSPELSNSLNFTSPEQLLKCWLIQFDSGCFPWEEWFRQANISTQSSTIQWMEVGTFDMGLTTVMAGHGVCLATDSLAGDFIERGLLVKPFNIGMTPGVQVNLCFDPSSPRKERVTAFTHWLHEEVNEVLEN
ncbi:LysR substrate-binding domain-containing protein [Vibrio splendidus]|uniref:LysR substrate-binding domain-containing protein n=1 Tax=Vibrio splendidus TaxID=29497 RepID=UPI001FB27D01|nr:LysR substrate-binding domain-containing protein [Vibrio splendidus]UOE78831.1 LysR substrate-binding domain-containing protein [Vibrio splendidus]